MCRGTFFANAWRGMTASIRSNIFRAAISFVATRLHRPLRRIKFNDPETGKSLVFLTNNFALPAMTIARLYKYRWHVELFFKWIKQHLRIKAFFGTSENAVKAQIWSAVCVYVLIAIVKKRLGLTNTLYGILQILSLTRECLIFRPERNKKTRISCLF